MPLKSLKPGMQIIANAVANSRGIKKKVFPNTKKKPFLFKNKDK